MLDKRIIGILIIFIVAVALCGCLLTSPEPKPPKLKISTFRVTPSKIYQGDEFSFHVEVCNKGNEIAHQDTCKVGIRVINPEDGGDYYILPKEQLINQSLSTDGEWSCTLRAETVQDIPIGDYKFQAYLTFLKTGEEFESSKDDTITIDSPTSASSPGLEPIFVIAMILLATYFVKRKKVR